MAADKGQPFQTAAPIAIAPLPPPPAPVVRQAPVGIGVVAEARAPPPPPPPALGTVVPFPVFPPVFLGRAETALRDGIGVQAPPPAQVPRIAESLAPTPVRDIVLGGLPSAQDAKDAASNALAAAKDSFVNATPRDIGYVAGPVLLTEPLGVPAMVLRGVGDAGELFIPEKLPPSPVAQAYNAGRSGGDIITAFTPSGRDDFSTRNLPTTGSTLVSDLKSVVNDPVAFITGTVPPAGALIAGFTQSFVTNLGISSGEGFGRQFGAQADTPIKDMVWPPPAPSPFIGPPGYLAPRDITATDPEVARALRLSAPSPASKINDPQQNSQSKQGDTNTLGDIRKDLGGGNGGGVLGLLGDGLHFTGEPGESKAGAPQDELGVPLHDSSTSAPALDPFPAEWSAFAARENARGGTIPTTFPSPSAVPDVPVPPSGPTMTSILGSINTAIDDAKVAYGNANPDTKVLGSAIGGGVLGAVTTGVVLSDKRKKKTPKAKAPRKASSHHKAKASSHRKPKAHAHGKAKAHHKPRAHGGTHNGKRVYIAKNGTRYVKKANGQVRFIK